MNNYPKYFAIDLITGRCNNHCQHCYSDIPFDIETLPYKKIVSLIDELDKSTLSEFVLAPWMLMHDPLLVKSIDRLVPMLKKRFPKGVYSSDGLVSNFSVFSRKPKLIEILKDMGIREYQFSFYGIGKTHDDHAGRTGAFDDIISVLPIMNNLNIDVKPIVWLHNKIGDDLIEIKKLLQKYDIMSNGRVLPAFIPDPVGRQLLNEDLRPTYEDLIEYQDLVPSSIFNIIEGEVYQKYLSGKLPAKKKSTENKLTEKEQLQNIMCAYTVLPSGDVYPFWEPIHPLFKLGNLFEDGIDHIHEINFGSQISGRTIINSYDEQELIRKWGNPNSRKLYSDSGWVIERYKLNEFYEHNPL
ncbi:MAG: radical SAM protein [Candidatus Marinimicrobia bacterium]|nr:radical SAM protein [Candidatus Neomarinimicrobiota bacterium]